MFSHHEKALLRFCLLFCLLQVLVLSAARSSPPDSVLEKPIVKKKYLTTRLSSAVVLDGKLSEEAWNAVAWGGDFIQRVPHEGKPPGQPTSFKILYDERFLYIGFRCHDVAPDSIIRRLGRRDEFPGDWVEINIDSYHDLRSAFSFSISASGVRGDAFISNNGSNWDTSWNPVWFAQARIDEQGWTAEVKIPFSQLRYGNEPEKTWGIQVTRLLFRKAERSVWQNIPQSSGVWVSGFGELQGLKDIPFHRQFEIAPYVTAQADRYQKEDGNPFARGKDTRLNAGIDGKLALTNDLILDFTVNPDFGQVEADPSQVRIDGFQNFFEERRPFFIESRNIFDYRITDAEAYGPYNRDLLFYSRRIGSSPHKHPKLKSGEYARMPQNTSILGAAKFSGKTKQGWSIGLLASNTRQEMALIDNGGQRRKETVEPLTNYFVGRLQKDIQEGNTVIGGILTSVNRGKGLQERLHRHAFSGGLDFLHYWNRRTWYIQGNIIGSQVQGSRQAILLTQTSFEHLFQRPGAREVSLDSSRTSLTGMGGTFRFGKSADKPGKLGQVFKFDTGLTWRSPGLELNDIGFMLAANEINHFSWAGLHFQKAFSVFRNAFLNYNHWSRWDYSGRFLYQAFNFNAYGALKNNWQLGGSYSWNPYDISNNALRGAWALRRPSGMGYEFYLASDNRKKVFANLGVEHFWAQENTVKGTSLRTMLTCQPLNALRISLSGQYSSYWRRQDQYVSSTKDQHQQAKVIVGEVSQKTLRFTGRLSFNISPDLTLQYYGQPYITRPLYDNFAYVASPLAKSYKNRFYRFEPDQISLHQDQFRVDENRDGVLDYRFNRPDFNFVQFRSNLVLRWEYKAGSELYLVWAQGNTPDVGSDLHTPLARSLFQNTFSDQIRNSLLLKCTYRFLK